MVLLPSWKLMATAGARALFGLISLVTVNPYLSLPGPRKESSQSTSTRIQCGTGWEFKKIAHLDVEYRGPTNLFGLTLMNTPWYLADWVGWWAGRARLEDAKNSQHCCVLSEQRTHLENVLVWTSTILAKNWSLYCPHTFAGQKNENLTTDEAVNLAPLLTRTGNQGPLYGPCFFVAILKLQFSRFLSMKNTIKHTV